MIEDDFPLVRQLAASSVIGRLTERAAWAVAAARDTSWLARQLERAAARVRTYPAARRLQTALSVVGMGAITHFALTWPAPAYVRSALPVAAPLVLAAIAFAVAFGAKSARRT